MTDLDERFEAYVFAPKQERIVQKWRVIQRHFMTLFLINGIIPYTGIEHFLHPRHHCASSSDHSNPPTQSVNAFL